MAYNENTVQRVREIFAGKGIDSAEKKMFSGVCFMVDGKMCCGTHTDKKSGEDLLMCRIGEQAYEKAFEDNNVIPMEFTGKPMKGYIYVNEAGFRNTASLNHWLQLCLDYNPLAKASKKK